MTRLLLLASFASLLPGLSGCSDALECGDGTHGEGSACIASLSPECGPGTKLADGKCVPDSGGGAECGPGTHSENGTCVPNINVAGNAARFYEADLTDPAAFIPIANGPFHDSFVTGENLVFIGTYTPTDTGLRLYGGGGTLNTDGSYSLDRSKSYDTTANVAAGSMTSAPFVFKVTMFGSPNPIVLVDTVISNGVMEVSGGITQVRSGKLSGVLTPEHAADVYIQDANLNLFDLINSLSIDPDVDGDHDGVKESWVMGFTFSTVPVWLF
jgi:hypothetical protein